MLYADVVAALSNLLTIVPADPNFVGILPRAIEYAENRLYRELDLAATRNRNVGFALTAGNRNLALPAGTFVVIDGVNAVSAGAASPDAGVRTQLVRLSWSALDAMFGGPVPSGPPRYYAVQDSATLAVGPWPDQAYAVEILGTIRPAPLSVGNTVTILSGYFPDLLVAACMVFMAGYQRDFGQQSDDPQMAQSWEAQYGKLMASAATEEARKKATMPAAAA